MNRKFMTRLRTRKEPETGNTYYLVAYDLKTLSLRGKKLEDASPEQRKLFRKEKAEENKFNREFRLLLSQKYNKLPEEFRVSGSVYAFEEYETATEVKDLAVKHGGSAVIFEAKVVTYTNEGSPSRK